MFARKILMWAATGYKPILIFTISDLILIAALSSGFMWIQLAGLCICGLCGVLVWESMPGGSLWLELQRQGKQNGANKA